MGNKNASKTTNQDFDDMQYWKNYFSNKLHNEIKIESDEFFKDRTPCFIPDQNFMKESTFLANFGNDRRTKVENTNKFPFSAIGVIFCETQDGRKIIGTGTLISSNLVLTSAYIVYDNEKNERYINHEFYIGLEDGIYRGSSKVKNFFFADEYKDNKNYNQNDEDYALLILEKDLGNKFGYMGLAPDYQIKDDSTYCLYGYPAEKRNSSGAHEQWGMDASKKGITLDSETNLLKYKYTAFDTSAGQSGSGLFIKENNGKSFIFGIHTTGHQFYKIGVYLTASRYQRIIKWIIDSQINTSIVKNLISLDLSNNNIREKEVEYLSKCDFKSLTSLNLSGNKIGNEGVEYLSKCDFKNLITLDLSSNIIGEKGVEYLSKCDFKNLTTLDLSYNNIGEKEKVERNLISSFPKAKIIL